MYKPQKKRRTKPPINKEVAGWPLGYRSNTEDGTFPEEALADMTNVDLTLNDEPTPRWSLVRYGADFVGECIGVGKFEKTVVGTVAIRQRWLISVQVIEVESEMVGRVFTAKDGAAWVEVEGDYSFDPDTWINPCHSNDRVYLPNGVDNLTFYDIIEDEISVYEEIPNPTTAPTLAQSGLTGTNYTLYYTYTECNEAGETAPAVANTVQVSKLRESWNGTSEYVDVTLPAAPSGTDSRNIYVGTAAGQERFVGTIQGSSTTFRDDGRAVAAISKRPPLVNSTKGPLVAHLTNILGQMFGWGDKENPSYIWYDGGGEGKQGSGNFTISGGGGYIGIDDGGPSIPMAIVSYRTGKGDPVPTVICRGAGDTGGVRHISFTPQTIGDLTALMPAITEANGTDGTNSPRAVLVIDNSIHFPTASAFKFYGSAPNIPNILSPDNSSDFILPDVRKLTPGAMPGACGLVWEGRAFFALPVISETNNQIWVLDPKSNPARWIMPWLIPAKHMWLYEDNSNALGGVTHFCLLVDNKMMEFSKTIFTEDDGVAFSTRVASGPITWSKAGMAMANIQKHYFKVSSPRGKINFLVTADTNDGPISEFAQEEVILDPPNTGWGQFEWGVNEFGEDPLVDSGTPPRTLPVSIEIKETISELRWEITTEEVGCNYAQQSTFTDGLLIPKLYAGD